MGTGVTRGAFARVDAAVVAALFVLSVLFVGLHVQGYTKLSPIDELQHIDYLYQVPDHPEPDDKVGQAALHQQMCRGIDAPDFPPPGCQRGRLDPDVFQERGFNTAAVYTPLYYSVTRAGAEAVQALSPADDLVTAGRLMGGFWLGLGLSLVYAAGRLRGLRRGALAPVCVLVATSPAVLYPSSTIAPDAAALAVGGALLLSLSWWEQRPSPRRAVVLVVLAAVASLVKMTYLCVVAAVALYLLLRWARSPRGRESGFRPLVLGVVAAVASLAASFGWSAYVARLPQIDAAELPDMATRFQTPAFPWAGLGDSLFVLVQPLSSPWVVVGTPQLVAITTALVTLVLTSGTVAAAVFGAAEERERDLARGTLLAALVCGVGLVVLPYVTTASYIPLPARYGMALVAPMMLGVAACARSRTAVVALGGVAAVSVAVTLWRLVSLS